MSAHELIPLENPQPAALFAPGGLDQILARIEADSRALVPDIGTAKGRAVIASLAMKIAKAKTYLDGLGKDYTADLKRQTGAVDAERKAMRDRLDALKAEVRRPLDEWEQAEVDRVAGIRARIDLLRRVAYEGQPSDYYTHVLTEFEATIVDESFAEFQNEAQQAKDAACYRWAKLRDDALAREAAAAKAEAERKAAESLAQKEREDRIAREAAERAKAQAESAARREREAAERAAREAQQKAQAEQEAARQAQAQAEQRAKDAEARAVKEAAFAKARAERAARDERERIEAEQRAKQEADSKRAADEAHRERILEEIVDDLVESGAAPNRITAINATRRIAAGRIRHLTINY